MVEIVSRREPMAECVRFAGLFQDRLLEEPPRAGEPAAVRHRYRFLAEQARRICATCPLRAECLYDAVVRFDVNGYVAGTTEQQRAEVRRRLGVTVEKENLDRLTFTAATKKPIDPAEVVRMRKACPDETLESIAERLGCSLSTVKRHLRRHRAEQAARAAAQDASEVSGGAGESTPLLPKPTRSAPPLPDLEQVLRATGAVLAGLPTDQQAA